MNQTISNLSQHESSGLITNPVEHKIAGCILMAFMIIFVSLSSPFPMLSGQHNTQECSSVIHLSRTNDNHQVSDGGIFFRSTYSFSSVARSSIFYEEPKVHPFFAFTVKAIFWGMVVTLIRKIIRHHTGYYDFKMIES